MENTGYSNSTYHLQELSDTQYEVAKGDPDIRGWDVVDLHQNFMGKVKELLYDSSADKVRYAVLDLQNNQAQLKPRLVLVPVGMTEVQEQDRVVVLTQVSTHQLEALPPYEKGQLNQQVETKVLRVFAGEPSIQIDQKKSFSALAPSSQPSGNTSDNAHLYPKQIAFDRSFSEADLGSFKEGTLELQERQEEPILHKKPFVVEEIVVGKDVEMHDETIYETVKKTEVAVTPLSYGDPDKTPPVNPNL